MSFSAEWDECYQKNTHMSIWPWSDLVSLVMRNKPKNKNFKVLELGCGAGANIPLFDFLGADYYAVEGSATIVEHLHKKYPKYKNNIIVGDFTEEIPNQEFDLVIDRASLTHNDKQSIINCLDMCAYNLTSKGKFIGVDWFSTNYSEYKNGISGEDIWTKTEFDDGNFAGVGKVHFSDKKHLIDLFSGFRMVQMFHKTYCEEIPVSNWQLSTWNFVAEKL